MNNTLGIKEGSVSFWIKAGVIDFADGESRTLIQVDPVGGSISVVKDSNNNLVVSFVALNIGRVDVRHDVSKLSNDDKHLIAITWKLSDRLAVYVDGKLAALALLAVNIDTNICYFNVLAPLVIENKVFRAHALGKNIVWDVLRRDETSNSWVYEVKNSVAESLSEHTEFTEVGEKYKFTYTPRDEVKYVVEIKDNKAHVIVNDRSAFSNMRGNSFIGTGIGLMTPKPDAAAIDRLSQHAIQELADLLQN